MKLAILALCVAGSEGGTVSRAFPEACIHRAWPPIGCITPRCGHVAGRSSGPPFCFAHRLWEPVEDMSTYRDSDVKPKIQRFGWHLSQLVRPCQSHLLDRVWLPRRHEREGRDPVARRKKLGDAMIHQVRPVCTPKVV
jgi:hypothetical protein